MLREAAKKLNYEYLVWLDADTIFVRDPGDVLSLMQGSPIHSSLESDAAKPNNVRKTWWGCSLPNYVKLMRAKGVCSRSIYNVNAGFWIVHHDIIETFCDLALEFWHFCTHFGYKEFTEEPPLAYATHMLCGNPYLHTIDKSSHIWVSDWLGCYIDMFPDGRGWMFEDYFSGERCLVNPAIVHAMRSKKALVEKGKEIV